MKTAVPVNLTFGHGWLHRDAGAPPREVAILICPALNRDALDSHQAMRVLADQFAKAGFAALRFDYPATGNAADLPPDAEIWQPWMNSVREAADFLRASCGVEKLLFCGLRFGGLLAAHAAATRDDAAGLLLLEPVWRGQSYLLQLWIEAGLKDSGQSKMTSGFTLHELSFGPESVRAISSADLRQMRLPGQRVAVFARGGSRLGTETVAGWRNDGAAVSLFGFEGLAPVLRHNLNEDPAAADFSQVVAWADREFPALAAATVQLPAPVLRRLPWGSEEIVSFGPGGRLRGILSRPRGAGAGTVVLIGNCGRDPQYGYARFGVELSRQLAAAGIASLRFDFSGLGDSAGPAGRGDEFTPLFALDRTPDITAALDFLAENGFAAFAGYGLCSGAYHMLHGAVADPRLRTLLLINLPLFVWKPGEALDFALARHRAMPLRLFLAGVAKPASWRRIFSGALPAWAVLRGQAEKLWRAAAAKLPVFSRGDKAASPAGICARLAEQGTRTLFLYAPDDIGLYEMELNFNNQVPGGTVEVMPAFDHMLSTAPMRTLAAARMIAFLQKPGAPVRGAVEKARAG